MIIGTVRPQEARISDEFAGYQSFHHAEDQDEYGSLEIFWHDGQDEGTGSGLSEPGWYWWACFPGCLPDGEPAGPFASSRQALEDADEWNPEFDD